MSTRFAFKVPHRTGVNGGLQYAQVRLGLIVEGPGGRREQVRDCVVDSGAAFTIFDSSIAELLGIDLTTGTPIEIVGISSRTDVWLHPLRLHLPGMSFDVTVGFQQKLPVPALLGMNGFMEHFRITFDGPRRVCEFERTL